MLTPQNQRRLALAGVLGAALLVIPHEGMKQKPYQDTGGVWTDCYGHTGADVKPGQIKTPEQCTDELVADLLKAQAEVASCVHVPLPANERNAYIDFDYNVGGHAFCRSSIARLANEGDHRGACDQILRWVYVGPKDCRIESNNCAGIVKRRQQEYALCIGGNHELAGQANPGL